MRTIALILPLFLIFVSCKSPSYLSKPKDFQNHVKGLFFESTLTNQDKVFGEIIEVTSKDIKILPLNKGEGIKTIPKEEIKSAFIIVSLTSDDPKKVGTRAAIATLTTLGHGFWGVFTLPINLGLSISTAQYAAKGTYRILYPDNINWLDISRFARFPQGIPKTIDANLIQ